MRNEVLAPFEQPDNYRVCFPGAETGTVTDWSSLYGNPAALEAAGLQTQQDLVETPYSDSSPTGQAYQTLLDPLDRARPDLSTDPLWDFTDATVGALDDFTATYADCTWETTFLDCPRTVHVPDYEACLIPDTDQPRLSCTTTRTLDATVHWDPVTVGTDPETGEPIIELVRRVEKRTDRWDWASSRCAGSAASVPRRPPGAPGCAMSISWSMTAAPRRRSPALSAPTRSTVAARSAVWERTVW